MDNIKEKSGHSCPCQNCPKWPSAENNGRESLLNRLSCSPDDPVGKWTELFFEGVHYVGYWHHWRVAFERVFVSLFTSRQFHLPFSLFQRKTIYIYIYLEKARCRGLHLFTVKIKEILKKRSGETSAVCRFVLWRIYCVQLKGSNSVMRTLVARSSVHPLLWKLSYFLTANLCRLWLNKPAKQSHAILSLSLQTLRQPWMFQFWLFLADTFEPTADTVVLHENTLKEIFDNLFYRTDVK